MATAVSALGSRFFWSIDILSQMHPYNGSLARLFRLGDVSRTGIHDCAVSPIRPARTNCTIE